MTKTAWQDLRRPGRTIRKEVMLGLLLGFVMLVAIGVTLSVVDPYLRGSGSPVFSIR